MQGSAPPSQSYRVEARPGALLFIFNEPFSPALVLCGVRLTSSSGPAINCQRVHRVTSTSPIDSASTCHQRRREVTRSQVTSEVKYVQGLLHPSSTPRLFSFTNDLLQCERNISAANWVCRPLVAPFQLFPIRKSGPWSSGHLKAVDKTRILQQQYKKKKLTTAGSEQIMDFVTVRTDTR